MATIPWYEDRKNLMVLLDWIGYSDARHVLEKPWHYEAEMDCAAAALNHEHSTGHTVFCGDGTPTSTTDSAAYCGDPDCDWTHNSAVTS